MTVTRLLTIIATGMLGAGCVLFGSEEQPSIPERLPVVDDSRPFDPSQAVDDDDGLAQPGRARDRQDQDAFADSDASRGERAHNARGPGAAPQHREAPADADARGGAERAVPRDAAASRETRAARPVDGAEPARDGERIGPELPPDEQVASPAEVEALRERRRRAVAAAGDGAESDGDAKAAIATNPPPEPLGKAKPTAWTVRDYALEGVLLATVSAAITLLLGLARRAPKAALGITIGAVAIVVAVLVTQGE